MCWLSNKHKHTHTHTTILTYHNSLNTITKSVLLNQGVQGECGNSPWAEGRAREAGRGEGEEEITTTTAASPKTAGTHTQDEISLQKFTPSIINTQKTRHSLSLSHSLYLYY